MYKTIILTFIILFFGCNKVTEKTFIMRDTNHYEMFLESYQHVRKWEGNYSYLEHDKGGETYAGISRKFNKKWKGWKVLDRYKKHSKVSWNKKIDEMEVHVMEYYYSIWIKDGYHKIKDPIVRDYLFDYRNNGLIAYRHVKELLMDMGFSNLNGKAVMDEMTIEVINKVNPVIFILRLYEIRTDYYQRVADENPEMRKYLKGWMNRANNIVV
jgi:hypothetical protein